MMLFGGYITHPIQAVLDYPLAFACVGAAGLLKERPVLGTVIAGAARFVCHVLSGVIFFSSYAPKGQSPWVYSAIYNASYLVPCLLISGVLAIFLLKKLGAREAASEKNEGNGS
jgi:thiamine transporter